MSTPSSRWAQRWGQCPLWWLSALRGRWRALAVAIFLSSRADDEGKSAPTIDEIAAETGVARNKIFGAVRDLERHGVVLSRTRRFNKSTVFVLGYAIPSEAPNSGAPNSGAPNSVAPNLAQRSSRFGVNELTPTGYDTNNENKLKRDTSYPNADHLKSLVSQSSKRTSRGRADQNDFVAYAIRDRAYAVIVANVELPISAAAWQKSNIAAARKLAAAGHAADDVVERLERLYADPELRRFWGNGTLDGLIKAWTRLGRSTRLVAESEKNAPNSGAAILDGFLVEFA
jgi:hypothetical protein